MHGTHGVKVLLHNCYNCAQSFRVQSRPFHLACVETKTVLLVSENVFKLSKEQKLNKLIHYKT